MPKKTIEKIITTNNDYLIALKGNQKNLLKTSKEYTSIHLPIDEHQTTERQKGRLENREVSIYNRAVLELAPHWWSVAQIIKVRRFGKRRRLNKRNKKEYKAVNSYDEVSYYITNRTFDSAQVAGDLIRKHWSIENELHYPKDTIYKEDKSKISLKNMAINKSILYTVALNLIRVNGFKSIQEGFMAFGNRIQKITKLINYII